jgi:SAM-dependent methyltransferase
VAAVGVDLAPSAVAEARATAAAAGLENLRFDVGDVLALTEGQLGEFDYVIVHGLYAWSPEPVREAVLAACRSHLAADGIAYVSYTAHPGGHLRQMLREAAQFHARGLSDPRERAERARGLFTLLDRLEQSDGPSFYGGVVGDDVHALATAPETMLVHDLLGAQYEPVWFADFAAAAGRHGLAYVGDAIPESSQRPPWSEGVDAFVDDAAGEDRIAREQYFDLLVLRRFRHSLLCLDALAPTARVDRDAVRRMLVAEGGEPPVPFEEFGMDIEEVVRAFDSGNVTFHAVPSPAARVAGERPLASPLARSQARPGAIVTTLENHVVRINDEPTAVLLGLLDGTRDRVAIREAFPGELTADALDAALAKLAELGLLVA